MLLLYISNVISYIFFFFLLSRKIRDESWKIILFSRSSEFSLNMINISRRKLEMVNVSSSMIVLELKDLISSFTNYHVGCIYLLGIDDI